MHTISVPLPILRRLLASLADPQAGPRLVQVGYRQEAEAVEWLARATIESAEVSTHSGRFIAVSLGRIEASVGVLSARWPGAAGYVLLPSDPGQDVHGEIQHQGTTVPLDELRIIGAGMHRFLLTARARSMRRVPHLGFRAPADEHWSRTIGSIGGADVWRRLASLSVAIVGCGRTGSIALGMLKRVGVRQITLVDPDRIEFHNCGEMDLVDQSDVGWFKVEALRRRAQEIRAPAPCQLTAISEPMTASVAIEALKRADVLICAADSDAARLGAALLATLYHKVLLDVGTGVLERATGGARGAAVDDLHVNAGIESTLMMGADVRLVLPSDGCLMCWGGLTNYVQAVSDLSSHRATRSTVRLDAGRRMGSLRSLNQMAVAIGLRMLEDLVGARLTSSTWARLEYDRRGRMSVRYPERDGGAACTLCRNAGLGDEGL